MPDESWICARRRDADSCSENGLLEFNDPLLTTSTEHRQQNGADLPQRRAAVSIAARAQHHVNYVAGLPECRCFTASA
jgi:hypothetical protein